MKKLLLVSAIVLGSASIASAQASEPVAAAKTTKATKTTKTTAAVKDANAKQTAEVTSNQLAGARPTVSNATAAPAKKVSIRKVKPAAAAKN